MAVEGLAKRSRFVSGTRWVDFFSRTDPRKCFTGDENDVEEEQIGSPGRVQAQVEVKRSAMSLFGQ